MATESCPYCRQRTPVMVVRKNTSGLSDVQCMKCKKGYQLDISDIGEELRKAHRESTAADASAAGELVTYEIAQALDELQTGWDRRLARAVQGIEHPVLRSRAREEELIQMTKESRQLQEALGRSISSQATIRDVSAEELGKAGSALALLKQAHRQRAANPVAFMLGFEH